MCVVFRNLFILRGRESDLKKELPHACNCLGRASAETRSRGLSPGHPRGRQEPSCLNYHHCLPGSALSGSYSQELQSNPSASLWDRSIFTTRTNTCRLSSSVESLVLFCPQVSLDGDPMTMASLILHLLLSSQYFVTKRSRIRIRFILSSCENDLKRVLSGSLPQSGVACRFPDREVLSQCVG